MKWLMVTLSGTLLFTTPTSNLKPFQTTEQSVEKQADINGMVHKNNLGLIKHPIETQFENKKLENEKKKAEEQKQKELEQKKNEPEWQEFILTFYSGLACENSPKGNITCTGKKLESDMIANNVYKLGTQIYLEGYGQKVVADRGSNKHFGTSNRLDVYIEKEPNESESHYLKRVNSYGVKKVKGYVIK
jgi:3D (Asp-Asp-Asp) domain-containing protein